MNVCMYTGCNINIFLSKNIMRTTNINPQMVHSVLLTYNNSDVRLPFTFMDLVLIHV